MYRLDSNDVARRYLSGESQRDIANSLGVSPIVVKRCLAEQSVTPRPMSEVHRIRYGTKMFDSLSAREAHESGESLKAMSERLGVPRPTLKAAIESVGGTVRNRSEAMFRRMAVTSPEERLRLTERARATVRGVPHTEEQREKFALSRQSNPSRVSNLEIQLAIWIAERGEAIIQQLAIGRYNADLALTVPAVAVEVFGGHWHANGPHAARYRKRMDDFIDRGWAVVVVWATEAYPLSPSAADYIVALSQRLRRGEPRGREEHVVWCQADGRAVFKRERPDRPVVPHLDSGQRFRGDDTCTGQ